MADLPPLDASAACFFDFDGTLVDVASRPELVQVSPAVVAGLTRLHELLDGAVALVSGRAIADLDQFLDPLRLPAAGVHGAERRSASGAWHRSEAPPLARAAGWLTAWAAQHPGSWLEEKPGALVLHFRAAPELEPHARAAVAEARALTPDALLKVVPGKMIVELASSTVDKGQAVLAFMADAPFAGRRPWFFGDDRTDESAFEAVRALDGVTVKVGPGETAAAYRVEGPAAVRDWLARAILQQRETPTW